MTIAPDAPIDDSNCYPFGNGGTTGGDVWLPFAAFFYKDIPAFGLRPGDVLGFDLSDLNDTDIGLDIAMAPTTSNGGTAEAKPFKRVVRNTNTPNNPRGNTTLGDFELRFKVKKPFLFRGGGLAIRFSDPSAAYALDTTCSSIEVTADAFDTSGFFVARAYNDPDGGSPWLKTDTGNISGFEITDRSPPETEITKHPRKHTEKTKARFKFKADEPDSTFKCKLDHRRFKRCGPRKKKYKGLDLGAHKFKVKATDPVGHTDRSPAKFKWEILP